MSKDIMWLEMEIEMRLRNDPHIVTKISENDHLSTRWLMYALSDGTRTHGPRVSEKCRMQKPLFGDSIGELEKYCSMISILRPKSDTLTAQLSSKEKCAEIMNMLQIEKPEELILEDNENTFIKVTDVDFTDISKYNPDFQYRVNFRIAYFNFGKIVYAELCDKGEFCESGCINTYEIYGIDDPERKNPVYVDMRSIWEERVFIDSLPEECRDVINLRKEIME